MVTTLLAPNVEGYRPSIAGVLVYTTYPLGETMEITGPVSLTLYAASSVPATDFSAKLVSVRPCGCSAMNLTDGGHPRSRSRVEVRPQTDHAGQGLRGHYRYVVNLGAVMPVPIRILSGGSRRVDVSLQLGLTGAGRTFLTVRP